jgi:integrase
MSETTSQLGHDSVIAQTWSRQVKDVNLRLKAAAVPVSVEINGRYLLLRATLPCKPGDGLGRKRYKLSLSIPASLPGLKRIEAEAHRLGAEIANGSFSWANWQNPRRSQNEQQANTKTYTKASEIIERYRLHYLATRPITEASWENHQTQTFNLLPQDAELSPESLLAAALAAPANSRQRKRSCQHLAGLARFAGIAIDLKPYQGTYGRQSVVPRDLPLDSLIVECRDLIPSKPWQWLYGMLATFGLRPHEAFFCQFVDPLTIHVAEGTKTGFRVVRAILPEWAETWQLQQVVMPKCSGKTNREYGSRVTVQFKRYQVPFPAYNLRHAYAIRGSVGMGVPVSTMAAMLGHSPTVHSQIYHRWLTDATNEAVYKRLVLGKEGKEGKQGKEGKD